MTAIVWTTLITAAAAVTGSLGAVWIKGHFDDRTEVRKAKETSVAEVSGRRREAYAQLLTTARKALEQARLRQATLKSTGKVDNRFILSADDLAQVVALAELLGSPQSHRHVRAIYDKAAALNHSYVQLAMPAASPTPGNARRDRFRSLTPKVRPRYLPPLQPLPDGYHTLTAEQQARAQIERTRAQLGTRTAPLLPAAPRSRCPRVQRPGARAGPAAPAGDTRGSPHPGPGRGGDPAGRRRGLRRYRAAPHVLA